MDKLNQRISVRLGDKEYTNEEIDIDFMYDFDDELDNNTSEINLWNVNYDTIKQLKSGTQVVLNAGYEGDEGVILIGKVGDFETNYHDVDKELKLYVSDGLNLWGIKIKATFENLKASQVLTQVLDIAGIQIGKIEMGEDISYENLVLDNSLENVLKKIAADTNSKFYIKNGKGYFVKHDFVEQNVVLLNKDSGLLGSPTTIMINGEVGWQVECLLEHRIGVGSYIQLESRTANGNFKVVKGSHNSDFTTNIEVLPI